MCSERREYKFPVQIDDQFDKAVTVIGYRSGNYLWHECQTCGRNKPRTGYLNAQGQIQAIPTHVAVADHKCPICGVDGVLIGIKRVLCMVVLGQIGYLTFLSCSGLGLGQVQTVTVGNVRFLKINLAPDLVLF
jgi:hypothetical protein